MQAPHYRQQGTGEFSKTSIGMIDQPSNDRICKSIKIRIEVASVDTNTTGHS